MSAIGEDPEAVVEQLLAALYRDGAAVLTDALSPEACAAISAEMQPYLDASADAAGSGRRAGAVLARSGKST